MKTFIFSLSVMFCFPYYTVCSFFATAYVIFLCVYQIFKTPIFNGWTFVTFVNRAFQILSTRCGF